MRKFLKNASQHFYRHIFREEMSEAVKLFFKNISYITLGTIISALLSFIFNILAGRILGPVEYGKFALVSSIALFLYIPMLPGLNTALVKYVSEKNDFHKQSKIISTAYMVLLPLVITST